MIDFLRKIWSFVQPYRGRFFLGLLCGSAYGILNGLLVAAIRVVAQLVFDGECNLKPQLENAPKWIRPLTHHIASLIPAMHAPVASNHVAWILIIGLIPVIMLFRNTLQYLSIYLTNWSAMNAIADVRTKLFSHLQNLSLGFFNRASTGDLIARITNDTQVLSGIVGSTFASAVKDPITIVILVACQLITNPTLTLISIIVFPVCVVPIVIFGRKVRKSARAVQTHNSELTNLMHESFTGNRVIKAYNLEETVSAQFRATTKKYVGQMMRVIRANEIPSQLTELFGALGVALVFFYVVNLPKAQQPTETDFLAFIASIVLIYPPVKSLTRLYNQLHQARAASERVFQLLAMTNSVPEPVAPKMLHADKADIVFENVDFNFGETPILRNINLTVKAGQMVAFVGHTGSGKTTLVNLLLRFYDPLRGSIKIGGVDLREVRTADLRNQMAVVAQENILFNESVRRNIELGRLGATNEEIVAAARFAKAEEFILQRQEGYDTVVGEKGITLSGGQRQRLAIARAILKNAPILILDEATSALDNKTEREIQAELDSLMIDRTTFCIAHRLSTVMHADLIVVLDQGRIAERGRHQELIALGGIYANLYRQFTA